jgi:hypothetical protein
MGESVRDLAICTYPHIFDSQVNGSQLSISVILRMTLRRLLDQTVAYYITLFAYLYDQLTYKYLFTIYLM